MKQIQLMKKVRILSLTAFLILTTPLVMIGCNTSISNTGATNTPEFHITFSVDGAGGTLTATVDGKTIKTGDTVPYGKTVVFTATPAKGHKSVWQGVTADEKNPNVAQLTVTKQETIMVSFIPEGNYAITYYLDGGKNNPANPASYNTASADITLQPAVKTGYNFQGWYTSADYTGEAVTKIAKGSTGNKAFWAKWAPSTYPVTFSADDTGGTLTATVDGKTINTGDAVPYGKTVVFTATPAKGHKSVWQGITADEKNPNKAQLTVTKQETITVSFVPEGDYTITYHLDGGKNDPANPASYNTTSVDITLQPAEKTGYNFQGWYTNADYTGAAVTKIAKGSTGNKAFWAKWETKLYPITFSVDGTGGTLTATVDGKTINTGNTVPYGKTVVFTAVMDPAIASAVGTWMVNPGKFTVGGTEGSTEATVTVTEAFTVTVRFKQIYTQVPYSELNEYLQTKASTTGINHIEVTGLQKEYLSSSTYVASPLGEILKTVPDKKIVLKLPAHIEGLTDMTNCFSGCTNLIQVFSIPVGVTTMDGCFYGCTGLTQAPIIPANVTSMNGCFSICTSLTQAPNIPASVTALNACFSGCTSLKQAPDIPADVTAMNACFSGCTSLTQVPNIPEKVTEMDSCFSDCTSLRSVTLNCKYIEGRFGNIFTNCKNLGTGSIKVPNDQLDTYKAHAQNMGTQADNFAAK